jgi:di/tricarboxylate transporter
MQARYGLSLLAVSRRGRHSIHRVLAASLRVGDVLLTQGAPEALADFASEFGCVPLEGRSISIPNKRRAAAALIVLALSIAGAAFGLLPAAIAFAAGVLVLTLLRLVSPRAVYEAIDWPIIVLLASLIPVAEAMASTGTADVLAQALLGTVGRGEPVVALTLILIVTMTLSDFMNNAATAAVMCPIAISTSSGLGVATDPFLMAVAIGASCAFLTPIGHQNNTLILGPGGFRFGDYWRLGLPMEILVVVVGVPMLLWIWPL